MMPIPFVPNKQMKESVMIIVPSIKDSNSSASKSRLNHGFRMQESEISERLA